VLALFTIINLTTAIALAVLALSLALVWGYGGILNFGQVAFFGLGAYAYTIAAVNFGGTTWAILVAVAVACIVAAALGYFMFYGRVSDVYLGVITLTFTLILFSVMRRTSGPEYKIGNSLLGGFNGISSPPLNLPWDTSARLFPEQVFYVAMAALILCYLFTAWLVNTHFGRVCVAIRENETRAELLGYDTRAYKLGIFTIGAGIAAIGGVLFCNGVGRVTPDVFGLYNAALVIIWVIVGGRGDARGAGGRVLRALLPHLVPRIEGQHQHQPRARHHPDRLRPRRPAGHRAHDPRLVAERGKRRDTGRVRRRRTRPEPAE
jgi:ABC-type branched-subunit amino acid transport system permease subunit